ncbi:MAG: hypothetical protein CMP10_16355 [Zetaproteobacteria bacterium]|nr:hypothetical protein [Pseudobdellovibrionaceae bacterium]
MYKAIIIIINIASFVLLSPSCKLKEHRLQILESSVPDNLVDLSRLSFKRSPTGTSAVLSFPTKTKLQCSLEFWSLDDNVLPLISDPSSIECNHNPENNEIVIRLENIYPDTSYGVRVLLWPPDLSKSVAKSFVIKESPLTFSAERLILAKTVVPQYTTEFSSVNLNSSLNSYELSQKVQGKLGCSNQNLEFPFKSNANRSFSNIQTSGFAEGSAQLTKNQQAMRHDFSYLQTSLNWEFSATIEGEDRSFSVSPPAYIDTLNIKTGKDFRLKNNSLNKLPEKIPLTSSEIQFSWVTKNVTRNSWINIDISNQFNKIVCRFPESSGKASIPKQELELLAQGDYKLTAKLESYLYKTIKSSDIVFLFGSNDWRYANLTKL